MLVGLRACELRAQRYLDKVLLEGPFTDLGYRARREATIIVSVDCTECSPSCFCTLVGGKPFAEDGFDLNLTPMGEGYLVESGSPRGQEILQGAGGGREATREELAARERIRREMVERIDRQNEAFSLRADDGHPPALPNENDPAYGRFAGDCIECAACTNICPTCHCFYLYDQVLGPKQFERLRAWDSCLLSTYHRMAGGVNMKISARPRLLSRLANRVLHKFVYSPQQYGMLGCVGCGRCVEACLGDIDIRRIVSELST